MYVLLDHMTVQRDNYSMEFPVELLCSLSVFRIKV
jgi:hypothetical protein